jgi:hypothetical protein
MRQMPVDVEKRLTVLTLSQGVRVPDLLKNRESHSATKLQN